AAAAIRAATNLTGRSSQTAARLRLLRDQRHRTREPVADGVVEVDRDGVGSTGDGGNRDGERSPAVDADRRPRLRDADELAVQVRPDRGADRSARAVSDTELDERYAHDGILHARLHSHDGVATVEQLGERLEHE